MISPEVLARQRAVLAGAAPVGIDTRGGPAMTSNLCPRCRERPLAKKNQAGVCYRCHDRMSRRQRMALVLGYLPARRARPKTIAKAKARLAAHGIQVEAA